MMRTLTRQFRGACLVATIILVGGLHTVAQSRLDVVSVRENPASVPPFSVDFVSRPGRLDIINLSLQDLVDFGYGITSPFLRDELIVGWPKSGIQRKRFDIRATLSTNETLSVEDQRRVVLMAYFEGKTHVEISDELAVPLGTVKSRMRLALDKMRAILAGRAGP